MWETSTSIAINGVYSVDRMKFPDGAINIRIKDTGCTEDSCCNVKITAKILSSDDLISLILTVDAIKRISHYCKIILVIPYFPYSRQDRVVNNYEAFSLSAIANIFNSLDLEKIVIYDPHSPVLAKLLKRCFVIEQHEIVDLMMKQYNCSYDYIVSPDAGAEKKAAIISLNLGIPLVRMHKSRNPSTGKIEGHTLMDNIPSGKGIIFDDICDGGATFIYAANVIENFAPKENPKPDLYVTHGIFSKGFGDLKNHFENVFFSNSLHNILELEKINRVSFVK